VVIIFDCEANYFTFDLKVALHLKNTIRGSFFSTVEPGSTSVLKLAPKQLKNTIRGNYFQLLQKDKLLF
jgi:hypothetical protein